MFQQDDSRAAMEKRSGAIKIERDAQRPTAILRVANELEMRGGEIVELFKEVRSATRQVVIPIHLRQDDEDFFIEVETGAWDEAASERVIGAVSAMRATLGPEANLELVSAYPIPRETSFFFEHFPAALLQLDLFEADPAEPEACAELFRETAGRHWDVDLGYGPEGLPLAEELLRAALSGETERRAPILDGLVHGLGCYVGEVIRRGNGGRGSWQRPEDWGEDRVLEFSDISMDPVGKARAFLERGDEDSIAYYAEYVSREIGKHAEAEK
ncbi:MAG: hypothetical protein M3397_01195 [Actinomycetota bacterium]|nr:hypothetical protein [Rubrobacter sp.]MDQ3238568.1 hypothetical protein [Actinomycetota bacterium]MDQ3566680.1 hypothetical protein [Actinomycetota bacterium]